MKNLREEDMCAELKERLQEYTEDPDSDAWNKIAGVLPSQNIFSGGIIIDHIVGSGMILLLLLQFLMTDPAAKTYRSIGGPSLLTTPLSASTPVKKPLNKTPGVEELSSSPEKKPVMVHRDLRPGSRFASTAPMTNHQQSLATAQNKTLLLAADEQPLPGQRLGQEIRNDHKPGTIVETNSTALDSAADTHFHKTVTLTNAGSCEDIRDSTEQAQQKPRPATRPKKDQAKRFRATIYGSITTSFAYQNVVPFKNDDVTVNGLQHVSIFDPTRIGFQLDAGYQRPVSRRVDVYGGIMYYRQHQRIGFYQSGEAAVTSTGDLNFTLHPSDQTREVNYFMQNVGVTAGFFYLIRDGKLQHKAGVGLQYQVGLETGDQTYNNRASTYLNYQLAYRLQLQFSENKAFFVQPSFNHVLRANEALHEPFGITSYRAGIGLGLLWKL